MWKANGTMERFWACTYAERVTATDTPYVVERCYYQEIYGNPLVVDVIDVSMSSPELSSSSESSDDEIPAAQPHRAQRNMNPQDLGVLSPVTPVLCSVTPDASQDDPMGQEHESSKLITIMPFRRMVTSL